MSSTSTTRAWRSRVRADQLTVSGNDASRIFELYGFDSTEDDVVISGLTLRDGFRSIGPGGAIGSRPGPGEAAAADLTILDSVLTDNHAARDGGAVYSRWGALTITNSAITDNYANDRFSSSSFSYGGGGVSTNYANRDGSEDHAVVIQDSVLSDNVSFYAGSGGGANGGGARLHGSYGDVLIEGTTISGNDADGRGGGLAVYRNAEDGATTTIRNSTISDNYSGYNGGGIWWQGTNIAEPGHELIENTTVSGNEAAHYGGGILSFNNNDTLRTIRNSTIVGNEAGTGVYATGDEQGGGIYAHQKDDPASGFGSSGGGEDELILSSTIVASNSPSDLGNNEGKPDFDGAFLADFSLIENPGEVDVTEDPAGSSIFGQDPQLGPLASNGGPTQTHHPAALSSPVIDAGIANGLSTDQRDLPRTVDRPEVANRPGSDATDIGSVEFQLGAGGPPGNAQCQAAAVPSKTGTEGDDTLVGTAGPDTLIGLGGNDSLKGAGGRDCLSGGAGKDKANGGAAKDKVKGDAGKDALKGGGGKDRLSGGPGNDTLRGGGGKDRLKGGPGKDKLSGGGGKDRLKCGGGQDKVIAQEKDKVSASCEKVVEKG